MRSLLAFAFAILGVSAAIASPSASTASEATATPADIRVTPVANSLAAVERVRQAVYKLEVVDQRRGTHRHWGTAFVLCGTPNVAITARHVLAETFADSAVLVRAIDTLHIRGLLKEHAPNDVVALAIAETVSSCIRASDSIAHVGDMVTAIGWPGTHAPSTTRGQYLRTLTSGDSTRLASLAVLPHGASGGVLLDSQMQAIGVIHGIDRRDGRIGYATPLTVRQGDSEPMRRLTHVYGTRRVQSLPTVVVAAKR